MILLLALGIGGKALIELFIGSLQLLHLAMDL